MPWISINEWKRRSGYEERRKRRADAMPFQECAPKVCGNKDCPDRLEGRKFQPTTPWQDCCSKECRNHKAYVERTLPKRHKAKKGRKG